jgi:hypothetical protein
MGVYLLRLKITGANCHAHPIKKLLAFNRIVLTAHFSSNFCLPLAVLARPMNAKALLSLPGRIYPYAFKSLLIVTINTTPIPQGADNTERHWSLLS